MRFVYWAPRARVGLETTAGLIGILTAYLVFGRFRRSSQLRDLALVYAFLVLGATNVMFAADVWHSIKKHWCLEAQQLIRARRAAR